MSILRAFYVCRLYEDTICSYTIPTPETYRSHNVPDSLVSGSTPRVISFVDLESSSLNERGLTVSGIEKSFFFFFLTTTYIKYASYPYIRTYLSGSY